MVPLRVSKEGIRKMGTRLLLGVLLVFRSGGITATFIQNRGSTTLVKKNYLRRI
jgi:hypothetical protein